MLIWLILMLRMVDSDADYEDNADDNWWRYFRWSWCWWNWSCNICNDAKVDHTLRVYDDDVNGSDVDNTAAADAWTSVSKREEQTPTTPRLVAPIQPTQASLTRLPHHHHHYLHNHHHHVRHLLHHHQHLGMLLWSNQFKRHYFSPHTSSLNQRIVLSALCCVPLPNWGFSQAVNLQTLWQTSPQKLSIGRQPVSLLSTRQANDKLTTT